MKSSDIHIWAISQEMPQPPITKICLKITYLKFRSVFPGANELNWITHSLTAPSLRILPDGFYCLVLCESNAIAQKLMWDDPVVAVLKKVTWKFKKLVKVVMKVVYFWEIMLMRGFFDFECHIMVTMVMGEVSQHLILQWLGLLKWLG